MTPIRKARSFLKSDDGLTNLEFAIVLALGVIAALAVIALVGSEVARSFGG